eukprot:658868-Amorphochlora_amoeboformis.AAC.1
MAVRIRFDWSPFGVMANDKWKFSGLSFKKFLGTFPSSRTLANLHMSFGSVTWRDCTSCHLYWKSVTTGYCRLLPDKKISNNFQNLKPSPESPAISSYL